MNFYNDSKLSKEDMSSIFSWEIFTPPICLILIYNSIKINNYLKIIICILNWHILIL